jgi:hypothetical protein
VKRLATALVLSACVLSACGDGVPDTSGAPDQNDQRGVALYCLTEIKGLDAEESGEAAIQVGDDPESSPLIEFFVTSGEAEGRQFNGNAQGAEHIGNTLLFVRDADDELLDEIEDCLQDL